MGTAATAAAISDAVTAAASDAVAMGADGAGADEAAITTLRVDARRTTEAGGGARLGLDSEMARMATPSPARACALRRAASPPPGALSLGGRRCVVVHGFERRRAAARGVRRGGSTPRSRRKRAVSGKRRKSPTLSCMRTVPRPNCGGEARGASAAGRCCGRCGEQTPRLRRGERALRRTSWRQDWGLNSAQTEPKPSNGVFRFSPVSVVTRWCGCSCPAR